MKTLAHIFIIFLLLIKASPVSSEEEITFDLTLTPTVDLYEDLCRSGTPPLADFHLKGICEVVVRSEVCEKVDPSDRLSCDEVESKAQVDFWELIKGCAKGVFTSGKELVKFTWEMVQWVWENATSSEARDETFEKASEYMRMIKLYLHTEYSKAYAKASPPMRELKALKALGGEIGRLILKMITDMINETYQEFGCYSFEAKSKVLCQFVGDIFMPPAAAVSLLKYGPKVLKQFPNLEKAFKRLERLKIGKTPDLKKTGLKYVDRSSLKISPTRGGETVQTHFPNAKKGVADRGPMARAHHYEVSYKTADGADRYFKLIVPSMKDGTVDAKALEKINEAIAQMPEEALNNLDSLRINPRSYFKQVDNSAASATAEIMRDGSNVVDIYPEGIRSSLKAVTGDMSHELGHLVAAKKYGAKMKPDVAWDKARKKDGIEVSEYGSTNTMEDFAEAMKIYIETDGGLTNPEVFKKYSGRFKILDDLMQFDPAVRKEILTELRIQMAKKGIFWTTVSVAGVTRIGSLVADGKGEVVVDP